jgi:hypothetical protein
VWYAGAVLSLDRARELGAREDGLAVVATLRPGGAAQLTVVNAGVVDHPVTGEPVVAFVARGYAQKLPNLRARPAVSVLFRSGWEWVAVEGTAELAGPADPLPGLDGEGMRRLVRSVYAAAVGGSPDDWAALDETFAEEGHTAVLVRPARVYSNPEPEP